MIKKRFVCQFTAGATKYTSSAKSSFLFGRVWWSCKDVCAFSANHLCFFHRDLLEISRICCMVVGKFLLTSGVTSLQEITHSLASGVILNLRIHLSQNMPLLCTKLSSLRSILSLLSAPTSLTFISSLRVRGLGRQGSTTPRAPSVC